MEIKAGATTVIKSNTAATAAAGYAVGSVWIDTTNDKAYVCLDATATVWTEVTQSGGGGPSQAALEAETNEDTYAPPDMIKHSPGVAKAWVNFHHPENINASYNITSITDDATTPEYTITLATDMSTTNYVRAMGSSANRLFHTHTDTAPTAGAIVVELRDSNASIHPKLDAELTASAALGVTFFGDQA